MQIGIIGAGNIGGTLARRLTAIGHDVAVANSRGPETLAGLAAESGAQAVTAAEAAQGRDVVVVTIQQGRVPELPAGLLADVPVVVDTGNYYPQRDGRIDTIEDGTTESRWVADLLGRPVVKAFNGIRAAHLLERGRNPGALDRIALPVAGDDPLAKATVMTLVEELGFTAVDAGGLDDSWRQQPGTASYGTDLDEAGLEEALAAASPERPADFRAGPS